MLFLTLHLDGMRQAEIILLSPVRPQRYMILLYVKPLSF